MAKKNRNRQPGRAKTPQTPKYHTGKRTTSVYTWLFVVGSVLVVAYIGNALVEMVQARGDGPAAPVDVSGPIFTEADYARPALSFEEIQEQKLIVDVHEHIQSVDIAPIFIDVMDELGIGKMCLMGSSWFTITLDEAVGFTRWQQNNEELIKIIQRYPDRFEAWPTLDPMDENSLDHLKEMVAQGATGVKLYIGHGYVTKANKYMFHEMAMDDPRMMAIYAYCEENFIPICMHVNPFGGKPGFAQEVIAVLMAFPDLKVDLPHFVLSSIASERMREFLDTFPNVYSNISFGDYFAPAGLKRISKDPRKFKTIFRDYPDRFMFAADLVLTEHESKTPEWAIEQSKPYLDMLTKETYTASFSPGETLNGLNLPPWILERVLFKNFLEFKNSRPEGTIITREINWDNMRQDPIEREPGQAFPPPPKE